MNKVSFSPSMATQIFLRTFAPKQWGAEINSAIGASTQIPAMQARIEELSRRLTMLAARLDAVEQENEMLAHHVEMIGRERDEREK